MNQIKNPMDNFDGGLTPTMQDMAQQVRIKDSMERSMKIVSASAPKVDVKELALGAIRTDGDTRTRFDIMPLVVEDYANRMTDGIVFPPVTVFFDGSDYWLADGFYRVAGAAKAGWTSILTEIRAGSTRDARLFAASANQNHGARLTRSDIRNTIQTLLKDPEWAEWSNRAIAKHIGTTDPTVGKYRKEFEDELTAKNKQTRRYMKGGEIRTMDVGNLVARGTQPSISPDVLQLAQHLPFLEDPHQVKELGCLPFQQQLEVVSILAEAQMNSQWMSVRDGIWSLKLLKQTAYRKGVREQRIADAQKLEFDNGIQHGNCVELLKQLPPQSVRLLLADGPYGVGYTSSAENSTRKRISSDQSLKKALEVHREMLKSIEPAMLPDSHVMLFCDKKFEPEFRQVVKEAGYTYMDALIWYKGGMGRPFVDQAFRTNERIIWFTKGKPQLIQNISDVLCHTAPGKTTREEYCTHTTPKPLSLMAELISTTTVAGECVCDPFAGSATTLVAAKALGRRYLGTEEDLDWFNEGSARLRATKVGDMSIFAPPIQKLISFNTYQAATNLAA